MQIPGFKNIALKNTPDLIELPTGGDGLWKTGHDGVVSIFTMLDKKADFIVFEDKTLVYIHSAMGYPAMYELKDDIFEGIRWDIQKLLKLKGKSGRQSPLPFNVTLEELMNCALMPLRP